MKKVNLYETAQVVRELPGIAVGEFVKIVRYHDYNGTYTIRSISGVLQAMVSPSYLDRFCSVEAETEIAARPRPNHNTNKEKL